MRGAYIRIAILLYSAVILGITRVVQVHSAVAPKHVSLNLEIRNRLPMFNLVQLLKHEDTINENSMGKPWEEVRYLPRKEFKPKTLNIKRRTNSTGTVKLTGPAAPYRRFPVLCFFKLCSSRSLNLFVN
ncbi:unnamed protein product [Leptidea sinapis]|uniref:Uncharacterized protein n=1 Tax=Leptidea sinapis TaxID=189913 RepID=A0A5E4Q8T7_9NEOP|nr:unnamed protein product [Leptidea sinapis]